MINIEWVRSKFQDWLWAALVSCLGFALTGYFAITQRNDLSELVQSRLETSTRSISEAIDRRVTGYSEIAFGLRSLFVVDPKTSRLSFERAVTRLDIAARYPGIKNIAFTRYVTAQNKESFERAVRIDKSLTATGYPGFAIHPAGERKEYFVADYLWPESGSERVRGLDISAQPVNLASMKYAMETGRPTASAPFDLIQETTDRAGFVVRVPVFANTLEKEFLGSVAVTMRAVDLISQLGIEGPLKGLNVTLKDLGSSIAQDSVSKTRTLFEKIDASKPSLATHSLEMSVYGRRWLLTAESISDNLSQTERNEPLFIAVGGGFISVLLGALVGMLGRDKKRALSKAAATDSLLQSVLRHTPIRVFWKGRDGRYLGCNPLFAKDAGLLDPEQVIGKTDEDLAWRTDASIYRKADQEVMDTNYDRLRLVELQIKAEGKPIWIQKSKVPLRNPKGEVIGVLGIYDDITERRLKDEELGEYRNQLQQKVLERTSQLTTANERLSVTQFAMEKVGIGVHWIDIQTKKLIDVNGYAAQLLGYKAEQMRGMPFEQFVPVSATEDFSKLVETARREEFVHLETEQITATGLVVPVEIIAYCQTAADFGQDQLIVFVTDISARKASELELRKAKASADAANAAKSSFLSNISHEIRTPLNAIAGMAYLIRQSGLSLEQAQRMQKLESASSHLLGIINAVLEISKIEAGKFQLAEERFLLEDVVENAVSMLRERAFDRGIEFDLNVQKTPLALVGDSTRLQQCLVNYLANAVRFSENARIAISANVIAETSERVKIRFDVRDNGIGISNEDLAKLFNVFEQADGSSTRKYEGTGLGLAITRKIAEQMDGEAGATSELGKGSVFWFAVWLSKSSEPAVETRETVQVNVEKSLRAVHSGRKVLVVEDNDLNQEIAVILLEQAGLIVELANDGAQAVSLCKQRLFDLILMDVRMPVMNGLDATNQIRLIPDYANVPILAMTANSFAEDRNECIQAGMNDFIGKPFEAANFFAKISEWLDKTCDEPRA